MRRFALPALVLVAFALTAAGCGNKSSSPSGDDPAGSGTPGAKVFASAGCASCHTMEAAGAKGTVGPNLDELRPNEQTVKRQVTNGGNGMPAFKSKLSPTEIQQVAAFVSTAAGTGRAGKISWEPNGQKVEDCTDTACYEQAFGNLAYNDGPKKALEELDKLSATNGTVAADCHPIAHKIGAGGLLRYKGDVGKAFADGSATCGSGYYHGLLQWKLAGVRADQVAGIASTVCKNPKIEANAFIYYQCNHGLGHGLMLYTGLDLPQALDYCHKLQTETDSVMCSGGVFMENQSSSFGLHSKWLSTKNLLFPCNSKYVKRQDKLYCYLLVTSHILPYVNGSWKKTSDWCRKSDPGWVQYCFQSLGPRRVGRGRAQPAADEDLLRGGGERREGVHLRRDPRRNEQQHAGPEREGVLRGRRREVPQLLLLGHGHDPRHPAQRRGREAHRLRAVGEGRGPDAVHVGRRRLTA